jgi:hypothetical protein
MVGVFCFQQATSKPCLVFRNTYCGKHGNLPCITHLWCVIYVPRHAIAIGTVSSIAARRQTQKETRDEDDHFVVDWLANRDGQLSARANADSYANGCTADADFGSIYINAGAAKVYSIADRHACSTDSNGDGNSNTKSNTTTRHCCCAD